jgi:hypothetical protein
MLTRSLFSTRELMRLVVLAALNLALFQGAWMIVVLPPITMLFAILNLTLYWTWVRRQRLSRPLLSSMLVGLAMALSIFICMTAGPWIPTVRRLNGWLPDWVARPIPAALLGRALAIPLDFALLDFLGFGSMVGAAWLVAAHQRSRRTRSDPSVARGS